MRRSKKFIIATVLAAIVVGACIGGVALAQDNEEESQTETTINTLLDKVVAILQDDGVNITSEQLQTALSEAQKQLQTEALQNYLEKLVAEGRITQEQADEYLKWMEAKPDMGDGFGFRFHGRIGFRSIGGMRGWGGLCIPTE